MKRKPAKKYGKVERGVCPTCGKPLPVERVRILIQSMVGKDSKGDGRTITVFGHDIEDVNKHIELELQRAYGVREEE